MERTVEPELMESTKSELNLSDDKLNEILNLSKEQLGDLDKIARI